MAVSLAQTDAGGDRWSLSDAELCDRYVDEQREITRLQARSAATLGEIDRRQAHQPGYLTATAFVRDRLGVSLGEERRRVGEARGLAEHPSVREAFQAAVLDRSRVGMLLHAAEFSPEVFTRDEAVLVESVAGLAMGDARRAVDYWRQAADRPRFTCHADLAFERRGLSVSETLGGMVRIDGDLDPESGASVAAALRSLVEPTFLDPTDIRTMRQRRADALVELAVDHLTQR